MRYGLRLHPQHIEKESVFFVLASNIHKHYLQWTSQVVFGPAVDGGYYLVGASRLHPDMFQASLKDECWVCTVSTRRQVEILRI